MKNFDFKSEKEVLDFLKENKIIRFVRIIFPDVLGREMSFCLPAEKMKEAFENGKGFDGSSIENEREPKLLDQGGYFHGGKWREIRKLAQIYLREMGISVILGKYVLKRTARKLGFLFLLCQNYQWLGYAHPFFCGKI